MAEQLSGTIVVIVIALGVQGCIMLFIFAKRQIVRFALRNRRGPHVSVGHGAPKWLRRDIDKAMDHVASVNCEPRINASGMAFTQHYNRARAVEEVTNLEEEVAKDYSRNYVRHFNNSLRVFLLRAQNGPFAGVDAKTLHRLCDLYEHARYHYEPFTEENLQRLRQEVQILRSALHANRRIKPCPSPLPLKLEPPRSSSRVSALSSATKHRKPVRVEHLRVEQLAKGRVANETVILTTNVKSQESVAV